ncbi:hypothetical protein DICPUDRAFT_98471 [Dictyostelium purpureum]|uniref:GPI mannosyltransferase 2 n=1 Tax=Dictyostelium purpureum TaxID=5786 RepID=F0ZQM8_DICPU|nr:uncharacterized protein DICPUDRAFT_98471 [Dictyostelium purpureum]EGC33755.1 hypothetical protein DICPUDRAFT_98471 [Dictyostelium purpureum]|eukprot:XP_003289721.1 hypothetical protein DICPUDRAFT_98471 [Dictyostelium purpureum]
MKTINKYRLERTSIVKFAITIKLIIWIYCLIVSQFLDNFDSSTNLNSLSPFNSSSGGITFNSTVDASANLNRDFASVETLKNHDGSPIVNLLIKRIFVKWDSIYFIRIAEFNYEHEQNHAFFPLFPISMNLLARVLSYITFSYLSFSDYIIISGFLISNISFIISAVKLLKLGYIIFNNSDFVYTSVLLYCINPAGIFTTAIYTENLFSLMVFSGLVEVYGGDYYLTRELGTHSMPLKEKIISTSKAAIYFALATATRANGFLMCGYLVYIYYSQYITHLARLVLRFSSPLLLLSKRSGKYLMRPSNSFDKLPVVSSDTSSILLDFIVYPVLILIQSFIVILPYFAFQYYGYSRYCTTPPDSNITAFDYSLNKNGDWPRPWCIVDPNSKFSYPNLYSFVQNNYWNQGFFNYYELRQIPNFLFATPMVAISVCSIVSYLFYYLRQPNQMIYPTFKSRSKNITEEITHKHFFFLGYNSNTSETIFYTPHILPFIVYLAFLTVFSVTFMHVQVITRFFIHSPLIFWYSAKFFMKYIPTMVPSSSPRKIDRKNSSPTLSLTSSSSTITQLVSDDQEKNFKLKRNLILIYFIFYNILGSVLFINFYPWT